LLIKKISIVFQLFESLQKFNANHAFFIADEYYSYSELLVSVSRHRKALKTIDTPVIGIVANDDLETYASILAIWFEAKAYLPLNTAFPFEYNLGIIQKAGIKYVFDSAVKTRFNRVETIEIDAEAKDFEETILSPVSADENALAYILFTSGSTGQPKGIPISFSNINSLVLAHNSTDINIQQDDRCLQMFDLTFDLSIASFLIPLLTGACVYTIPNNEIKYLYVEKLFREQNLTNAFMVPSMLPFLLSLVNPEHLNSLRCSTFCGEGLSIEFIQQWMEFMPKARCFNLYGPTEATMYCSMYELDFRKEIGEKNGIVSIGKPIGQNEFAIIDRHGNELLTNEVGELCIHGPQIMDSYIKGVKANPFVYLGGKKFYRSGDLVMKKDDGLYYFLGRTDSQVKIQGYRVELLDIENRIKKVLIGRDAIVYGFQNPISGMSVGLAIEGEAFDTRDFIEKLNAHLPVHMMPAQIGFMEVFPLNSNGKKHREAIVEFLAKQD